MNHLLVEMLGFETDTKFVHVPYRGVSALMSDLIAGHVDIGFATMPAAQSHIASGTLKALGVSSPKRLDIARDIPAVSETVPGYGTELWVGFFAVKGTPPEIVARLKQEAGKILNDPQAREALVKMGAQPNPSTGEELTARLKADLDKWKVVIARRGREGGVTRSALIAEARTRPGAPAGRCRRGLTDFLVQAQVIELGGALRDARSMSRCG